MFIDSGAEIGLARHPTRKTITQEVEACIEHGKADPEALWREHDELVELAGTQELPLTENNILFRRKSERLDAAMAEWWDKISQGSGRDQLSLPVVLKRHHVSIYYMPLNTRGSNPWFLVLPHIGKARTKASWRRRVRKAHRSQSLKTRLSLWFS